MSIFQTIAWQRNWWRIWGATPGFQLVSEGGDGVSGLYIDSYRLNHFLPVRCLQFVGTNYRRLSTPRTEYNTLCAHSNNQCFVPENFLDFLNECHWTEAVFRDVRLESGELDSLNLLAARSGWKIRTVAQDVAYRIDATGDFSQYISDLGSNTRRRLYNRRNILSDCGDITFNNAWPDHVDEFFDLLNGFHLSRWGQPCFNDQSLEFHHRFLNEVAAEYGKPELSVLSCSGKPVSVLYNVVYRGCVYNIQAGFIENFHKKLAVGTLHLGYCIEEAFKTPEVRTFDLLAGGGKRENYKIHLATHSCELVSLMVVRSRLFQMLYQLKDSLPNF